MTSVWLARGLERGGRVCREKEYIQPQYPWSWSMHAKKKNNLLNRSSWRSSWKKQRKSKRSHYDELTVAFVHFLLLLSFLAVHIWCQQTKNMRKNVYLFAFCSAHHFVVPECWYANIKMMKRLILRVIARIAHILTDGYQIPETWPWNNRKHFAMVIPDHLNACSVYLIHSRFSGSWRCIFLYLAQTRCSIKTGGEGNSSRAWSMFRIRR